MSRVPDQFAPAWLPRQQRRHIDRALSKLFRRNACSICGKPFVHNTRTAGGLDAHGTVVLAGACCTGKVAATFTMGVYSDHPIAFPGSSGEPNVKPTSGARIADAIALYQNVITETDKVVDDIGRRSGVDCALQVNLSDDPWKDDDRIWFEQNPTRAHRMRLPFPGEYDAEALDAPPGHVLLVLVRQVEPGCRIRPRFYLGNDLLPVPDDEAVAHALFEVAMGREAVPPDVEALDTLIRKYAVVQEPGQ